MTKYAFLDTNIYIYCLYVWDDNFVSKLHDGLKKDNVTLLLPEVVESELEVVKPRVFTSLTKRVLSHKGTGESDKYLSILTLSDKKPLDAACDTIIEKLNKRKEQVESHIEALFTSDNTHKIPVNLSIIKAASARATQHLKPSDEKGGQIADCIIIESVIAFLKEQRGRPDDLLYFCCANTSDFALSRNNEVGGDVAIPILHPDIATSVPCETKYYENLSDLLDKFGVKLESGARDTYQQVSTTLTSTSSVLALQTSIDRALEMAGVKPDSILNTLSPFVLKCPNCRRQFQLARSGNPRCPHCGYTISPWFNIVPPKE